MKRSRRVLSAVAMTLLACGGTEPRVTSTSTGACTVTVGGATSLTRGCSVALFSSGATGRITFTLTDESTVFVALDLGATALHARTYDPTIATGTVGYTTEGKAWLAAVGTDHDQGTFTLTLSTIGNAFGSPRGVTYLDERGTLDATLPAVAASPATSTVTVHAAF